MTNLSSIANLSGAPVAPERNSSNVVKLAAYRKSCQPAKPVQPKLSDLSFVTPIKDGRKRMCGFNCWNVEPSGNYTADCETGRKLALEYLLFLQRSAFPLQWILADMRQQERSGIEVGFLSVVTRAAAFGAAMLGGHLSELLNP